MRAIPSAGARYEDVIEGKAVKADGAVRSRVEEDERSREEVDLRRRELDFRD